MAENKTIQGKDLDMPCKHKNHTSLKHKGLKLACQDSSCKRPLKAQTAYTSAQSDQLLCCSLSVSIIDKLATRKNSAL